MNSGIQNVAVEIDGSGPPIVFIHGLGGTSNVFTPQIPVLSRFFTCVRLDLPGAGRSPPEGATSIEGFVATVLAVMEQAGITKAAHVVGHSMGTVVAQHLARTTSGQIASLALIGPIHAPTTAACEALRIRAATARHEGMKSIADAVVQGGTSAETRAHRPEIAALVREIIMRQNAAGYALHCEALAASPPADVAQISQPVLLITGDEDNTASIPASRLLASMIPNSCLRLLSRCGHWATFERSAEVTQLLLEFFVTVDNLPGT